MASVSFSKCSTIGNLNNLPSLQVEDIKLPDIKTDKCIDKPKKKKRLKKGGFNDIMKGFMTPSKTVDQLRQEHRDSISKNLGGGGFQKLERL